MKLHFSSQFQCPTFIIQNLLQMQNRFEKSLAEITSAGNQLRSVKRPQNPINSSRMQQQQPQQSSSQPQKQQFMIAKDQYYTPGQFSQYAVSREQKTQGIQNMINKTVQQAMLSHLKAVQEFMKKQNKLAQNSEIIQKNLKSQFTGTQLIQFLQNPIDYWIENKSFGNIQSYIKNFITALLNCHKYSKIEGKIIQINDLKLDQYIKNQNEIIFPTTLDNDVYVSVDGENIPLFKFFHNGKFKSRSDFLTLKQSERNEIVSTVQSFLKSKNILTNRGDVQERILNEIRKLIQKIK